MTVLTEENAKKKAFGHDEAAALLSAAQEVYVVKGKNVLHFKTKSAPLDDILAVALGPTGNLRAPAWRKGKTIVIGFDEATYAKVLA